MAKTAAQEFLDNVMARVPEGERAAVQGMFNAAHDEIAAERRSIDELKARVTDTARKQTEWWESNKDTVAENQRLKQQLEGKGTGVDEKVIDERLSKTKDDIMNQGLALATTLADLSTGHLHEFGERLNTQKLAADAIKSGRTLDQEYDAQMAQRRADRDKAARDKEIAEAEARGKKAGVEETVQRFSGQNMPFPGPSAPSVTTLSGLKPAADGAAKPDVLAAAVATANEVAARQAGT